MRTVDYLEAAKRKAGLASDYALAKRLGVSRQAITWYRNKGGTFDPTTAARVAELLEVDPIVVIAAAELERATKPEQRKLWERIAAKVAAGVLVTVMGAAVAPSPAEASAGGGASVYYVKRRRWWFPLLPPFDDGPLGPA